MTASKGAIARALVLTAILFSANEIWAEEVVLGISEYPPFKVQSARDGGPLTALVMESFAAAGVQGTIQWVPNNRAIQGVMSGTYGASFGWAHSPDRDDALLYSTKPIYSYDMVFVARKGEEPSWSSLQDLTKYRLGITRGNFYSQSFADLMSANVLHATEASSDIDNLRQIAIGRIDLLPIEESVGHHLISTQLEQEYRTKLKVGKRPFWNVPIYLVVSKKLPNAESIMSAFNRGFEFLTKKGRIAELKGELMRQAPY